MIDIRIDHDRSGHRKTGTTTITTKADKPEKPEKPEKLEKPDKSERDIEREAAAEAKALERRIVANVERREAQREQFRVAIRHIKKDPYALYIATRSYARSHDDPKEQVAIWDEIIVILPQPYLSEAQRERAAASARAAASPAPPAPPRPRHVAPVIVPPVPPAPPPPPPAPAVNDDD